MKQYQAAGLIHGNQVHHLDHLAPLCILMDIPLIVTEEEIEEVAKKFYPGLVIFCFGYLQIAENIVTKYDILFSSLPKDLLEQIFFAQEILFKKNLTYIWCPHGNSDKGHSTYFMEGLNKESILLVYGQKMIDFLVEKKACLQAYALIIVNNYRYEYYKRQILFYDALREKVMAKIPKNQPTILYTPTWDDAENSSSFFSVFPKLIKELPNEMNLVVKLHPNTLLNAHQIEPLLYIAEQKENILILNNFPAIYPLLNFVDIYLGDMSSIGYDFLTFNKPMFFLNHLAKQRDNSSYLFRCGTVIEPNQFDIVFSMIKNHQSKDRKKFHDIRKEVYEYVFGKEQQWEELRLKICNVYERYFEEKILTP